MSSSNSHMKYRRVETRKWHSSNKKNKILMIDVQKQFKNLINVESHLNSSVTLLLLSAVIELF